MEKCSYTIIIPHKNIPVLLQRCLDSIPFREDVQIIVVDDNSSSDIVDFSHFPGNGRKDVEIIYTHKARGAGYARNCGLEHAVGKWLLFADADDFFLPGFYDALDEYLDSDYDLITFSSTSVDSDTLLPVKSRQSDLLGFAVLADTNVERLKFRNDVPWAKMFSARLVQTHHLKFDETPAGNDAMFSAYVDYFTRKMAVSAKAIYCATVRNDSLQYGAVLQNLLARVSVACRYNRFLHKIGRSDKYVYSYSRVDQCRKFYGWKGYYRALWIYIRKECPENVYDTFKDLLVDKLKRIILKK